MFSYLLGIGKDIINSYLGDLIDYAGDKIIDYFDDLTDKIQYKDISTKIIEILNKVGKDYSKKIKSYDYKESDIIKEFDKNKIYDMIDEIFEEEKIDKKIKDEIKKKKFDNLKLKYENDLLIILLKGNDIYIKKFLDAISKIFGAKLNKKNEYIFDISELKEIKINKIKLTLILNDDIDCIWQFKDYTQSSDTVKDTSKSDETEGNTTSCLPVVNVYFEDKIDPEQFESFSKLNISIKNSNYKRLFNNYIIDINKISEETNEKKTDNNEINEDDKKKPILTLIDKTILNIVINYHEEIIKIKSKQILDKVLSQTNFNFGNNISDLFVFNVQVNNIIFKQFLFPEKVPISVKKKNKQLLQNFQKYLENRKNTYFSNVLEKRDEIKKHYFDKIIQFEDKMKSTKDEEEKNKYNLLIEIFQQSLRLIDDLKFIKDNNNKKKVKKNKPINIQSIEERIITILEDDFLNKSSIFINELIINTLKDKIINFYNITVVRDYFYFHRKELVFVENK